MQYQQKQSGIALIIVLWMLSLLIMLAMGYSHMVRIETRLTANLVHFNQATAVAEAGVWQAVSELLKPKELRQWRTDGTEYSLTHGPGNIKLKITNENGKIDLNTAQTELLYGLLESIDLDEVNHLTLMQSILDWRDRDNLVRNYGAEDDDYLSLGYEYGAKDGPFNSVDELQRVIGFNVDIYNKIAPALTVHSGQAGINPNSASRQVLLAIPGMTESQVNDFLAYRSSTVDETSSIALSGIDTKYLSNTEGQVLEISSEGIIGKTHAILNVIVMMKPHLDRPYTILSWQESTGNRKTKTEEAELNQT